MSYFRIFIFLITARLISVQYPRIGAKIQMLTLSSYRHIKNLFGHHLNYHLLR